MEEFRIWSNKYLSKCHLEDTQILLFGLIFYIGLFIIMDINDKIIW